MASHFSRLAKIRKKCLHFYTFFLRRKSVGESRFGCFATDHRRRIKTEEKAKVIAAAWKAELIHFFAMLAILHKDDLKKGMNTFYISYRPGAIHPILQIILVENS